MRLRNIIKILLVACGGIYLLYRSWDDLERMADNGLNLFGFLLIIGALILAVGKVLRS